VLVWFSFSTLRPVFSFEGFRGGGFWGGFWGLEERSCDEIGKRLI